MAFPVFFPENQTAVEKYGSKYGASSKTTVYNGPFLQKGWTGSNLSWTMVKNKNYWNVKAVASKVS
jgi:oligopeptide transport system substrate-binding protein